MSNTKLTLGENQKEIYFAGGCFWGMEKLFQGVTGVEETQCGYANGLEEIQPDYEQVCKGDTGYRETVQVVYDPHKISLLQLLTAFFHVIDPTVEKQQGNDIGDQYQTGVYYTSEEDGAVIRAFMEKEKEDYPVFAVECAPLERYYPAEDYHQDYLVKNPGGYCHISRQEMSQINEVAASVPGPARYHLPEQQELKEKLTALQYDVTQNSLTEGPFTGEYWNFDKKGIYVDVTTGQPLFSSLDKYPSSCGWPSFCAPIQKDCVAYQEDRTFGMRRTEVRSGVGDAHLGHVFSGEPESPNGIRYCINSASIRFVPYERMQEEGYGDLLPLFD